MLAPQACHSLRARPLRSALHGATNDGFAHGQEGGGQGGGRYMSRLEILMRSQREGAAAQRRSAASAGLQGEQRGASLRAAAAGDVLFITFGNSAVSDFLENWVLGVRRLGLPFLVGALDRGMSEAGRAAGWPVVDMWSEEVGKGAAWDEPRWFGFKCIGSYMHAAWGPHRPPPAPLPSAAKPPAPAAAARQGGDQQRWERRLLSGRLPFIPLHGGQKGAGVRSGGPPRQSSRPWAPPLNAPTTHSTRRSISLLPACLPPHLPNKTQVQLALSVLENAANGIDTVVVSDADAAWLQDPCPYFAQHPAADWFISTDCLSHEVGCWAGGGC